MRAAVTTAFPPKTSDGTDFDECKDSAGLGKVVYKALAWDLSLGTAKTLCNRARTVRV